MKTKELMIGDFITLADSLQDDGGPLVFQVVALNCPSEGDALMLLKGEKACDVMEIDDEWSGIQITPEILEKNGFENDFYVDESVADYVKVRLEGYSLRCKANGWDDALVTWCNGHLEVVTDFNGEVRKDIDHIHELQHALRLCGIEKEIVL